MRDSGGMTSPSEITAAEDSEERTATVFDVVLAVLLAQIAIVLAYSLPDLLNRALRFR
jgi:hypothetical protein